ncbi:hypothetical protein D3C74_483030 [compost metagenome]
MSRRTADKAANLERLAPLRSMGLMDADTAVNLVMDPDLFVHLIIIAAELNPVHAEIRIHNARLVRVL